MYKQNLKRIFDIIFAVVILIITTPVMIVAYIAVLVEDGENVIFMQDRFGQNAKIFKIYKFRTMKTDSKNKKLYVTKLGRILRVTSIDELPQLFNILNGDMSFIGLRPWITEYLEYFTPKQIRRCNVKPGITGWAQVNGRNGVGILDKIKFDLWYVDNISLKTDIKILFKTVKVVLGESNASLEPQSIKTEKKVLKRNYYMYNYRLNRRGV